MPIIYVDYYRYKKYIKHYMHGLTQIHLHNREVAFKVKIAEDVLYNEVRIKNKL